MMNGALFLTLFSLLLVSADIPNNGIVGQSADKPSLYLPFYGNDAGCENNRYKFEYLRNYASYEAKQERVIILVARPGRSEKLEPLQSRRTYNLKKAMEKYPNVVIVSGEKTSSNGKIEVYIAGKLEDEIIISDNKDLCMTCCEGESEYYPDIDRNLRKKRGTLK